jgi:hypothetical protein
MIMKIRFAAAVAMSLFAASAHADVTLFDYTAVVTSVQQNSGEVPLASFNGTTIANGATVHGTFAFGMSWDWTSEGSSSFVVDSTGYAYHSTPGVSSTRFVPTEEGRDDYGFEYYVFDVTRDRFDIGIEAVSFKFADTQGGLLTKLSAGSLTLADLESATVNYFFQPPWLGNTGNVTATLTSFQPHGVSPVPEPASSAMFAAGAVLVGAAALRRRAVPGLTRAS